MTRNLSPTSLIRVLHAVTIVSMIGLPVITLVFLVLTPITPATVQSMIGTASVSPAAKPLHLWAAIILNGLVIVVLLWTLNEMRGLFASYLRGEILTTSSARRIERIGRGLLGLAVLPFVLLPLKTALLTWANPPGERVLAIGVTSDMLGFALAAGLLMVIGWAMRLAAETAEENRAFI